MSESSSVTSAPTRVIKISGNKENDRWSWNASKPQQVTRAVAAMSKICTDIFKLTRRLQSTESATIFYLDENCKTVLTLTGATFHSAWLLGDNESKHNETELVETLVHFCVLWLFHVSLFNRYCSLCTVGHWFIAVFKLKFNWCTAQPLGCRGFKPRTPTQSHCSKIIRAEDSHKQQVRKSTKLW